MTVEHMLKRIREEGPLNRDLRLVRVLIGGADDSPPLDQDDYPQRYLGEDELEQLESRIQHCLPLEARAGVPLENFCCIQELISALIDIIDVHEHLVSQSSILHRHINIANLQMCVSHNPGHWPIWTNEPTMQLRLAEREKILQEQNFRRGLLIDFDDAEFIDEDLAVSKGKQTGTIPFVPLNILEEVESGAATNVVYQPRHDLESIIYALIWICVLYRGPKGLKPPLPADESYLRSWTTAATRFEIGTLWNMKMGELSTRNLLTHFTPYFQGLRSYVGRLYTALLDDHQHTTPLTHDILRTILLDAFFEVKEPESAPGVPTPAKCEKEAMLGCGVTRGSAHNY